MNFNEIKNWVIPNGIVWKVAVNNEIIWKKRVRVWIASLCAGPCTTSTFDVYKFSVDGGETWIEASTGSFAGSEHITKYIDVTCVDKLKIKFSDGDTEVTDSDCKATSFLTDISAYSTYDTIYGNWLTASYNCDDYTTAKQTVNNFCYERIIDGDASNYPELSPTKDSILYIGWTKGGEAVYENATWNLPTTWSVSKDGESSHILVTDNDCIGYTINADNDFYSVALNSSEISLPYTATCTNSYNITFTKNNSTSSRSSIITLTDSYNMIYECQITQAGQTAKATPSWDFTSTKEFTATGESSDIKSFSINVIDTDNVGWKLTSSNSRIYFGTSTNSKTTWSGTGSATVSVACELGDLNSTVTGLIYLYDNSGTRITSGSVILNPAVQTKGTLSWNNSKDPIYYNADSQSIQFSFTATNAGTVSVSSSESWCTTIYNGTSDLIACSMDENTSTEERSVTITLSATNADSVTKTLIQSGTSGGETPETSFIWNQDSEGDTWELANSSKLTEAGLGGETGWYKSGIEGKASTVTIITLNIIVSTNCTMGIDYYSDAESYYDYLMATKLDPSEELTSNSTYSSSAVDVYTRGKQKTKITKTYDLTEGTHTIQIMYRKDSSGNTGTDSGYFRVYEV